MKLLGWMHRKFRQNSGEPIKDLSIGPPVLDDLQCFSKPSNHFSNNVHKPLSKASSVRDSHGLRRKSFATLEAARAEDSDFHIDEEEVADYHENPSDALSQLFHGFLAIGTLGSADPAVNDPGTPTFPFSVENIAEKETEVTESDLKLINEELEKVLVAESMKDDISNMSSGRNSHVSNGRSSHGSTITLSGKQLLESAESNICPLQGYLFGSAIGLPETAPMLTMAKKENRTSLGELFQKSKMEEKYDGKGEKRSEKESHDHKSGGHLMKKILKKRMIHHASSRSGGTVDSASAETKLHKILQMFHRKVHPESSVAEKFDKLSKNECKNISAIYEDPNTDDITIIPQPPLSKERICCLNLKTHSNPSKFTLGGLDSDGNREFWIKTDADYLVLEL